MEREPPAPATPFGLEVNYLAVAGERPGPCAAVTPSDRGELRNLCDSVSSSASQVLNRVYVAQTQSFKMLTIINIDDTLYCSNKYF